MSPLRTITLEIEQDDDQGLQGTVRAEPDQAWSFIGWLDLLAALQQAIATGPDATPSGRG